MRRIIWHKWNDPMAHLLYMKGRAKNRSFDDDEPELQEAHDKMFGPEDTKWQDGEESPGLGPCVVSSDGVVIPINETNLPSKVYNFWVGHSNFDLGENNMADKIAAVPGVEAMECATRYRFRIAIGKAFDQAEVKAAIISMVNEKPASPANIVAANKQEERADGLEAIKRLLTKNHKFWAIYRMPSGKVEVAVGNSAEEVTAYGSRYEPQAKEIIKSW